LLFLLFELALFVLEFEVLPALALAFVLTPTGALFVAAFAVSAVSLASVRALEAVPRTMFRAPLVSALPFADALMSADPPTEVLALPLPEIEPFEGVVEF
jgi:hypothetical protein